jgi:hypothetical protein
VEADAETRPSRPFRPNLPRTIRDKPGVRSYVASVCIAEAVHARDDQRRDDWIEDSVYCSCSNCYLYTAPPVHDNEIILCSLGLSMGRQYGLRASLCSAALLTSRVGSQKKLVVVIRTKQRSGM